MAESSPSTMRRDLFSAYVASGMKVISWAIATTLIFRFGGIREFALFALIRGTLSFLNYTSVGLAPAIIHYLTGSMSTPAKEPALAEPSETSGSNVLSYEPRVAYTPERDPEFYPKQVGYSSLLTAFMLCVVGVAVAQLYAGHIYQIHNLSGNISLAVNIATFLGVGIALRVASDACGALLQAFGFIARDNLLLIAAELAWIVLMFCSDFHATPIAQAFCISSAALLIGRTVTIPLSLGASRPRRVYFNASLIFKLLGFGILVSLAQLADYLYAPTDFLLINRLIDVSTVGIYAPAVQIDAGLLLVVGGLASVLLPKAAIADAAGKMVTLRQYFFRGTVVSLAMLLVAAVMVYFLSPAIFRYWLGDPMLATQAILPLILIHTVVGGSSAVGRSILLGMGKVKPFTIAVLIAGLSNVALSYAFVRFGHLGLTGIVLGTICAVVGRCLIWQPWYVWRCLKRADYNSANAVPDLPQTGG